MAVDLRTAGLVLLICRRLMAVQADPVARVDPVVDRMTNRGRHPTARETVRRARCEVAYSWALRGAGGMRRILPRPSV